jgi:hypothetical protein
VDGRDKPGHDENGASACAKRQKGTATMGKREVVTEKPRYIKLNARDNVAIVVNDLGLPAGSHFPCGLELRAFVPQGHKTALEDIDEDAADHSLWRGDRHGAVTDPRRRMGR